MPTVEQEALSQLLKRFRIDPWDLLLIGDGSGSNWDYQCGWGCVSIERVTLERRVWYGAMSHGTVNFAEMMAYLQPLNWYASQREQSHEGGSLAIKHVHIITDSEYCRQQGESQNLSPKRNGALWRMFEDYVRRGIILHWHWTPREEVGLNRYADELSKQARGLMKKHNLQSKLEDDGSGSVIRTVYDVNP